MPRNMIENESSSAIIAGEAVEEKVSLSDRFGLWLGFHGCNQETYLAMIDGYAEAYGLSIDRERLHAEAREWAITRGSRSGRVAWQIGRAHVRTPVNNAQLVCSRMLEKKDKNTIDGMY